MFYCNESKVKLSKLIKLEEMKIPKESVFFGHENLQQGSGVWKRNYGMSYHLYLIPEEVYVEDAVAYVQGYSVQPGQRNMRDVLSHDVYPLYTSDEVALADSDGSRNTISAKMTGEGIKIVLRMYDRTTLWMRLLRRISIGSAKPVF